MGVLETDREPAGGFRAELIAAASGGGRRGAAANNGAISNRNANSDCLHRANQIDDGSLYGDEQYINVGANGCKSDPQVSHYH